MDLAYNGVITIGAVPIKILVNRRERKVSFVYSLPRHIPLRERKRKKEEKDMF